MSAWLVSDGELSLSKGQLTRQDKYVAVARKKLSRRQPAWRAERTFKAMKRVLKENFFTRPDVAFLREAYVCCRLAKHLNATEMEMLDEEFPDFRIYFINSYRDFECTEVMGTHRKRSDEYRVLKEIRSEGKTTPPKEIPRYLFSSANCITAVQVGCRKKVEKYGSLCQSVELVIYLNDYWPLEEEMPKIVTEATSSAAANFSNVHVLTDSRIFSMQ